MRTLILVHLIHGGVQSVIATNINPERMATEVSSIIKAKGTLVITTPDNRTVYNTENISHISFTNLDHPAPQPTGGVPSGEFNVN